VGILEGRVAVVTGAGRGIGRGVALELAAQGAAVVVNDYGVSLDGRDPESELANAVVADIAAAGGRGAASAASVADFASAGRIVEQAIDEFGRIDIVVTCAGILRDRMVFNMTEEEFGAVLDVHLKGTFNCIRHASTHLRAQGWGRIVTFASGAGLFGNPGQANYGSAKSAIGGLTKAVARDLGRYGVTANSICPVAATRMTMTEAVLKAREIRKQQGIVREESALRQLENLAPEDVAPMVAFLASDAAAHVNGQFFLCAGTTYSLLSQPRPVKTIFKRGRWTLDELDEIVPQTLAEGLANPAPPRQA
jgi:NAD(P)-dependent dehydrogenase (short-subunit alcohol dehydrogenase family)